MRRIYFYGLASLLGVAACDQVLGIEDARPGWTISTGTTGTGATGTGATGTGGSTGGGGSGGCTPGVTMACYSGPAGTKDVGICQAGTMTCRPDGSGFGDCAGEVTPQAETCASTSDEDCSGHDCAQWAGLFDATGSVATIGLAVDQDGNVVLVGQLSGSISLPNGSIDSVGTIDAFVLKLDAEGKPLWGKAFGGVDNLTIGAGVAVDGAGDVVVSGKTMAAISIGGAPVGPGLFVTKLSKSSGQPTWSRSFTVNHVDPSQFELDDVLPLAATPEGDVVLGGTFTSDIDFGNGVIAGPAGGTGWYGFVARLNGSDGSGEWGRALCSGTSRCGVDGVGVDSKGNLLLAAEFNGTFNISPTSPALASVGITDAVLAKLAPNGDPFWQRRFGAAGAYVDVKSLSVDVSDGPGIAGSFEGPIDFGTGSVPAPPGATAFVAQYASDKTHVWSRVFDAPAGGVTGRAAGSFVAGTFTVPFSFGAGTSSISPSGGSDVFIARFSESGAVVWSRGYGDTGNQWIDALAFTRQGDPIVVGMTESAIDLGTGLLKPTNGQAIFAAKLSP